MRCPYCDADDDKVIDSRSSEGGGTIRRRRECQRCGKRFTTYERVEPTTRLMVIKRDGSRVPFNRDNIVRAVQAACGKRPIAEEAKIRLAAEVEEEAAAEHEREITSREIAEKVMRRLLDLDEVAYVRFISEYHRFGDLSSLRGVLDEVASRPKDVKDQARLFEEPT